MKQIFYRYNPWWDEGFCLPGIFEREKMLRKLQQAYESKDIVFLTGLRRVGKTTLLRLMIQYMIQVLKVSPKHIFYMTLDDYSLRGKTLIEIIDAYRSIHRIRSSEKITLFLDEITFLPDYEIQLKNVYDMGGIKVYTSSSSASALKKGNAYITGRKRVVEVPPLDFVEYLQFKRIEISYADSHLTKEYFEDYLKTGGIPEYVLTGDIVYLHELVDDIICKDIAAVHGIKNLGLLKDFFMLLMERAGKSVSINKMAKVLDISPDTARRYLNLFEETFLIKLISRHGKLNEQLRSPKKLYAADLGIRVMFTGFRDLGSLFENYIFNKISHKDPKFILQDGIELDFITSDKTIIEAKYYDSLRPKQQQLFDSLQADKKLVIDSVEALELLEDDTEAATILTAKEPVECYVTNGHGVNLGRSSHMIVDFF